LLTHGASGVAAGTCFLATTESQYPPINKEAIVKADLNATTRSMAFDEVNRTMGWPAGVDGRAIANEVITDEIQGLGLEERMKRHDECRDRGGESHLVVWAGIGAGHVTEIKSASVCSTRPPSGSVLITDGFLVFSQAVFNELHEETVQKLQAATSLLG
jgi:nitronate monooxygenase